jgi:hypothetical protein
VPSCSSDSDSESPIISIPLEPLEPSEQESLEPSEQVPLPNPTINDIISSRLWKVKEDFEETHKLIYDMMKELIL